MTRRLAGWLRIGFIVGAIALVLLPFAWLVAAAFKDRAVMNEHLFLPPPSRWSRSTINLDNFRTLFAGQPGLRGLVTFWRHLLNSTVVATVVTCAQLICSSLGGFALAKYRFRGQRAVLLFLLGSMMVPGMLLLAPVYGLFVRAHLVDTLWALVLPSAVSAYGVFLFRQAIAGVPDEILDAARIDGCSELRLYLRVVMPLVRPTSAAFCLVTFLGAWNAFLGPNVLLHSLENLTLPIVLNLYVAQYANQQGVFLAGTLLAIVPPALLFLALQREFVAGLTSGAVKG